MNLIEHIYGAVGCPYLSDLKDPFWRTVIFHTINKMDIAEYSCEQWAAAFCYILGTNIHFYSTEEVHSFIETKQFEHLLHDIF